MSYLRFRNWERYQNADLAKKSSAGLAWVKLWTKYDPELAALPQSARLLFYELLRLAGRELNAIPNDMNWISGNTGLPLNQVVKGIDLLVKGAWLSETKTARRSRKVSRKTLDVEKSREEEKDKDPKAVSAREVEEQRPSDISQVKELVERSLRSVS